MPEDPGYSELAAALAAAIRALDERIDALAPNEQAARALKDDVRGVREAAKQLIADVGERRTRSKPREVDLRQLTRRVLPRGGDVRVRIPSEFPPVHADSARVEVLLGLLIFPAIWSGSVVIEGEWDEEQVLVRAPVDSTASPEDLWDYDNLSRQAGWLDGWAGIDRARPPSAWFRIPQRRAGDAVRRDQTHDE